MFAHTHEIAVCRLTERSIARCTRTALLVRFWCNEAWTQKPAYRVRCRRVDPLRWCCPRPPISPADWPAQSACVVCAVPTTQQSLPDQRNCAGGALPHRLGNGTVGPHGVPPTQWGVSISDGTARVSGSHQLASFSPALQSCRADALPQIARSLSSGDA